MIAVIAGGGRARVVDGSNYKGCKKTLVFTYYVINGILYILLKFQTQQGARFFQMKAEDAVVQR